ncbi:LysR family transcriptional regulator [Neiella marina]|uniref:LysR family transcriptional regulator n=1 Tax=Neiella holothuriorum TaxID=2870530 RepID=A0ABS7EHB8_9GAMM|nr:LysR family transcriptional regulator [Neiella holothuriorum]MBW8191733.1 LysR family transcriptional regulator [Neiella holothuriorum]
MSFLLDDNRIFMTIVECGSFTAAAERLDMPQPTISRRVKQLEQHLGLRLFERQGRSVQLTDFGQQFVSHCQRIEQAVHDAESFAEHSKNEPAGNLIIEASYVPTQLMLTNFIPNFLKKYPNIKLEFISITPEHWQSPLSGDIRFLPIPSPDENLISRPSMLYQFSFFAAPSLLEKYGTPSHPSELERFPCICLNDKFDKFIEWHYVENGQRRTINVTGPITVDHLSHAKNPAVQGLGVFISSPDFIDDELKTGALVPLFKGQYGFQRHGYLLYRSRNFQPLREKVFVEEFIATFSKKSFKI